MPTFNPVSTDFSIETILTIPIHILEDEYVTYTIDGVTHVNEPRAELGIWMNPTNNFSIWANMTSGDGINLLIPGHVVAGAYPFGNSKREAYIDVRIGDGDPFFSFTYACDMCDQRQVYCSLTLSSSGLLSNGLFSC